MSRALRTLICASSVVGGCAVLAPAVAADGLPLPVDGGDTVGLTVPGSPYSYSTLAAPESTTAVKIEKGTGEIARTAQLRGNYGVALVAYDATPSGLSADGETLVLWNPRERFPRRTTEFLVLDAESLKVREEVSLRGDFSFDAISPDGTTVYLIGYLDPRDPTAYEVRAYDLDRDRLLADPIVDEGEAPVTMGGLPQTRASSPDGRWAYTLYQAVGNHSHGPFIHALDTATGDASCIFLPEELVDPRNLFRMDLVPSGDGATLSVVDRGETLAVVDLATSEVSAPPAPDEGSGGALGWVATGGGVALLAIAGLALGVRRRRSGAGDDLDTGELERLLRAEEPAEEERDLVR